ncbi:MAG: DUF2794 domain-containing protein [Hyphomicrobiaceae bacterium]
MTKKSPVVPFRQPTPSSAKSSTSQPTATPPNRPKPATATFNRQELNAILTIYGRRVAEGEWRDYAIDMGRDKATFSIFRRSSENPLLRIEKTPKLARKQGAYSVVAATGMVLKRGHDLRTVLRVLEKSVRLVKA